MRWSFHFSLEKGWKGCKANRYLYISWKSLSHYGTMDTYLEIRWLISSVEVHSLHFWYSFHHLSKTEIQEKPFLLGWKSSWIPCGWLTLVLLLSLRDESRVGQQRRLSRLLTLIGPALASMFFNLQYFFLQRYCAALSSAKLLSIPSY